MPDKQNKLTVTDSQKKQMGGDKAVKKCPLENESFEGKVGDKKVVLENVDVTTFKYKKRDEQELDTLRRKFNSSARKNFLKDKANDPKDVEKLKEAGLTDKDIEEMKEGYVPDGYEVHHKYPLDDNGTNDTRNLVLIKNEPYHQAITNAQNKQIKDIEPGETKKVTLPMPKSFIYPE